MQDHEDNVVQNNGVIRVCDGQTAQNRRDQAQNHAQKHDAFDVVQEFASKNNRFEALFVLVHFVVAVDYVAKNAQSYRNYKKHVLHLFFIFCTGQHKVNLNLEENAVDDMDDFDRLFDHLRVIQRWKRVLVSHALQKKFVHVVVLDAVWHFLVEVSRFSRALDLDIDLFAALVAVFVILEQRPIIRTVALQVAFELH